jgi:hypothetical protein
MSESGSTVDEQITIHAIALAIHCHNAHASGEKPHALLEDIGRNRCLGDHTTSL